MNRSALALVAAFLILPGAAGAVSIRCPAVSGTQPLAAMNGAAVYLGDPADNVEMVPSSPAGVNTWVLPRSGTVTLVCGYGPGASRIALHVPPGARTCRQAFHGEAPPSVSCD